MKSKPKKYKAVIKGAAFMVALREWREARKPVPGVWICFNRQQLDAMGEHPPEGCHRYYHSAKSDSGQSVIIVTQEVSKPKKGNQ